MERSRNCCGVLDSSSIAAPFTPAQAHQKQGPFPPPALPGIHGTAALSDFRVGRYPATTLKARPPPAPDLPQLHRSPFLHAVPSTPMDRTGACRFLPHSHGLPRLTGGSASTTSLSRPPEASIQPVAQPNRSVATMSHRQLHRWILLPLTICPVGAHVESRKGAVPCARAPSPFPFPAHQTGHVDFPHPAFRLASGHTHGSRFRTTTPRDGAQELPPSCCPTA